MGRKPLKYRFLFSIIALIFLVLVVVPVVFVFISSFTENEAFSLKHYQETYHSGTFKLLLKSCLLAASVSIAAVFTGSFFGYLLSRTNIPIPGFLKLLLLLPLFVSPYYLAVAIRNIALLADKPTSLFKNLGAVAVVLYVGLMPVALMIMSASFAAVNSRLEEAGLLVTGRLRAIWSVIFPLVRPAIVSSFILIFIIAVSETTVAFYYIVDLLPTELFIQFSAFYNYKAAFAQGSVIIALSFVLLLAERLYLADAPFFAMGKKGNNSRKISLGKWKYPVLALLVSYIIVVIIIPVLALYVQTFWGKIPENFPDFFASGNRTIQPGKPVYSMEFFNEGLRLLKPVIADSVIYALLGSLVACLFGFVFAYAAERCDNRRMDYTLLLVFAIPSTLFGISLIMFYNQPSFNYIYTSALIILIGYTGKFTFVASKMIGNSIRQVPFSLEEAAVLTGANLFARMRSILLPLIFDGFFAAFIVCFIFCLGEMAITILVYPPGMSLLPIKIATYMHNAPEGLISAMVLIVMFLTFSLLVLLYIIRSFIIKRFSYERYTT